MQTETQQSTATRRMENSPGWQTVTFTSHYSYNAAGDITESTDHCNALFFKGITCANRFAKRTSMDREGKICYYHYDGHGNVRFLTDSDGNITDSYSYDVYGNLLQKQGKTENDFLYTGEKEKNRYIIQMILDKDRIIILM